MSTSVIVSQTRSSAESFSSAMRQLCLCLWKRALAASSNASANRLYNYCDVIEILEAPLVRGICWAEPMLGRPPGWTKL